MSPDALIDLFRTALETAIMMVAAVVLPGLVVGLCVGVFQAATQINEQTLSFIPRLFVTFLSLIFFAPWILKQILSFTEELILNIGTFTG